MSGNDLIKKYVVPAVIMLLAHALIVYVQDNM